MFTPYFLAAILVDEVNIIVVKNKKNNKKMNV